MGVTRPSPNRNTVLPGVTWKAKHCQPLKLFISSHSNYTSWAPTK